MKWVDLRKKSMYLNLLLRDSKLFSFKGLLSENFRPQSKVIKAQIITQVIKTSYYCLKINI